MSDVVFQHLLYLGKCDSGTTLLFALGERNALRALTSMVALSHFPTRRYDAKRFFIQRLKEESIVPGTIVVAECTALNVWPDTMRAVDTAHDLLTEIQLEARTRELLFKQANARAKRYANVLASLAPARAVYKRMNNAHRAVLLAQIVLYITGNDHALDQDVVSDSK